LDSQSVLLFLVLSGELDGLMKQIDFTSESMRNHFKSKIPDSAAELDKELSDEFWNGHKANIKKALYEETTAHFSEEHLQKILDFFNTDAGKSYLSWKAMTYNRASKFYLANVEMHRQANNTYHKVKDAPKG